jgi:hypothetical protein
MGVLPALLGLHYHVAKLRGAGGDASFAEWAKKAKRAEANEALLRPEQRILQRILTPEAAVGTLKTFKKTEEDRRVESAKTATEERKLQLARAKKALERATRLASATLAEAMHIHKTKIKNDAQAKRFGRLLGTLNEAEEKKPHDLPPKKYEEEYTPISFESGTLSVPDTTFKWEQHDVDACGKTFVQATGTKLSPPTHSLDYYAELADPTLWSKNNPESFKVTYEVATRNLPVVTAAPPQDPLLRFGGSSWRGGLFELAALEIVSGEAPIQFRNILNVSFDKKPKSGNSEAAKLGKIEIHYSLYESLTSSVFGDEYQGGIDADSGEASIALAANQLTMSGSKGIRFSDEASPFSLSLNAIALPWLMWWISDVIIDGLEA